MAISVPNQEHAEEAVNSVKEQHLQAMRLLDAGKSFKATADIMKSIPIPELNIDESIKAAEVHCVERAKWSSMLRWERDDITSTYFCQLYVYNHRLEDRVRLATHLKILLDFEGRSVPSVDEFIDGLTEEVELYNKPFYSTKPLRTGRARPRGSKSRGKSRE